MSEKTYSSHSDVKDALKMINRHLTQTFIRDFPFYLVLAFKMHTWVRLTYAWWVCCMGELVDIPNLLTGNQTYTSVRRWACSSGAALRRWRVWTLSSLPPPSWPSSRGGHSHMLCVCLVCYINVCRTWWVNRVNTCIRQSVSQLKQNGNEPQVSQHTYIIAYVTVPENSSVLWAFPVMYPFQINIYVTTFCYLADCKPTLAQ